MLKSVEKRVSVGINCDACTTLTKKEIQAKIIMMPVEVYLSWLSYQFLEGGYTINAKQRCWLLKKPPCAK